MTPCAVCLKPTCTQYACIPSFFGKASRPLGPSTIKLRPRLLQEERLGRFYRTDTAIAKDEAAIAKGENEREEGSSRGR